MLTKVSIKVLTVAAWAVIMSNMSLAEGLAPPPYSLIDRHGVNMASGTVSPTQMDLSIGGNVGLAHTITTFGNDFLNYEGNGSLGYREKFNGGLYKTWHHKSSTGVPEQWVLRVFDDSSTTDFIINPDAQTFTALTDVRFLLTFVTNYTLNSSVPNFTGFIYTKPDGTAVFYPMATQNFTGNGNVGSSANRARMTHILYSNGLLVTITPRGGTAAGIGDAVGNVSTNTGFQLKYIHSRVDSPSVLSDVNGPEANDLNWSSSVPKYIAGINNAIDYCTPASNAFLANSTLATACPGLTKTWPQVTYTWPTGMPRAMYTGPSTFKVTDAAGRMMEYNHTNISTYVAGTYNGWFRSTPRLTQIKDATANVVKMNYEYGSDTQVQNQPVLAWYVAGPLAVLKRAWLGNDSTGYAIGHGGQYPQISGNGSGPYKAINHVHFYSPYGISSIEMWDKTILFKYNDYINRPYKIDKTLGGGSIILDYDARGNVISSNDDGAITTADGYQDCNLTNYKTCSKATWTKDPNGNQTDYKYHLPSGQVETVTGPADKFGIRPQTRYTYEQKYAWLKNAGGSFQQAGSPLWLLTKESKCKSSAASGSGCSGGVRDEVITEYDYGPVSGPNNLFLRAVTVKAWSNGTQESRVTCNQYDIYGNKIGETKPKAGLTASSCPQ